MENADRKVPFASHPMQASSTCRPSSRRLKSSRNLQGLAFVYLFLVSWAAASGSLEGRFQQTSQPGFFAPSSIGTLPRQHTEERGLHNSSSNHSRNVYAASAEYNLGDLNLYQPYERSIGQSTEDSELPVLNLTLTTIVFFRNLEEDNVIMDIGHDDSGNSYKTRNLSKLSDIANVEKKHKGLKEFLKDRFSSKQTVVSVDENFERRVASATGNGRLSFLKELKGLTKRTSKTTTPLNLASTRQDDETSQQGIESSTSSITDVENLSVSSGGKSIKDMLGMIRNLKKSTAFPQSDVSESIQSRSRNEPGYATTKPKDDLSSAIRNFLKEGMRSSTVNLRVGSLANDSISLLPDNTTSNIDILSIRSNSLLSDDNRKASTFVSTRTPRSENTTSSTTTLIVDLEPIKIRHGATIQPILVNKTTTTPIPIVLDKAVHQSNSTGETTKLTFTTTIASTRSNVLIHRKNMTLKQSETTSPVIKQTKNLPATEFQQRSSTEPFKKSGSNTEEIEFQKFTTKFTEKTLIDIQTSQQLLKISSTKSTSDFHLITDGQGWDKNSTSTLETPHAGPIIEKEPLTIYSDTAGITVCLVILCVGLLLFVIGIYFVCQSSKARDSDNNVHPYSARRFSDA